MNRIVLLAIWGLLASVLAASPAAAITYTWSLGNPSKIVAYKVGGGVITIVSAVVVCQATEILPHAKPFVYDFEVGTPKGILCAAGNAASIAAYYQAGSPSTVTVNTKAGAVTITVQPAPPALILPPTGHLPFH
jgi:hypothetical protein